VWEVDNPGGRLFFLVTVLVVISLACETRLACEVLQSFEDIMHDHFQCILAERFILHGKKSGVFPVSNVYPQIPFSPQGRKDRREIF
jgi:hypothetical protein